MQAKGMEKGQERAELPKLVLSEVAHQVRSSPKDRAISSVA